MEPQKAASLEIRPWNFNRLSRIRRPTSGFL
jgi:hypothetical protein